MTNCRVEIPDFFETDCDSYNTRAHTFYLDNPVSISLIDFYRKIDISDFVADEVIEK